MPAITCALENIAKQVGCNKRGGIRAMYWTEYQNIDWASMVDSATNFDTANHEVLEYIMNGGAVWNKVEFEKKQSFYEFTYTADDDFYTLLLTLGFNGKDSARRLSLQKAIQCCEIVVHVFGYGGEQRVIGADYNGEVVESIVELQTVTRHLDRGGQLGTSQPGDEVDLGGESFFAPMFADVTEADIPLT